MNKEQIIKRHDELFVYLFNRAKKDEIFTFMPRQTNHHNRLNEKYWFPGNDMYLSIGFYSGGDGPNKTSNIMFQMYLKEINNKKEGICFIQLANTPGSEGYGHKKPIIDKIIHQLGSFEVDCKDKHGIERRWNRYYKNRTYLESIKKFIEEDKPIIDSIIKKENNRLIGFLDKIVCNKKISNIVQLRNKIC